MKIFGFRTSRPPFAPQPSLKEDRDARRRAQKDARLERPVQAALPVGDLPPMPMATRAQDAKDLIASTPLRPRRKPVPEAVPEKPQDAPQSTSARPDGQSAGRRFVAMPEAPQQRPGPEARARREPPAFAPPPVPRQPPAYAPPPVPPLPPYPVEGAPREVRMPVPAPKRVPPPLSLGPDRSRSEAQPVRRLPLERTDANAQLHDWLAALGQGAPPMMLTTHEETYLAVDTGMRGGFGEIFVAIDSKGQIWGIKQMRSPEEVRARDQLVALMPHQAHERSPVRGTFFHDAEHEVNLTQLLAPGLEAQNLMFSEDNRTYIAMKLMVSAGDTAFGHAPPHLRREVGRTLLRASAEKLAFIHAMGFVHRDVKLENTLVDNQGGVEIADFGLALPDSPIGARAGTYVAPEMLGRRGKQGAPADVFSLCASFVDNYAGATNRGPFGLRAADREGTHLMHRFAHDLAEYRALELDGAPIPHRLSYLSKRFANIKQEDPNLYLILLKYGMHHDPRKRATMQELVDRIDGLPSNPEARAEGHHFLQTTIKPPPAVDAIQWALQFAHQSEIQRS